MVMKHFYGIRELGGPLSKTLVINSPDMTTYSKNMSGEYLNNYN